MTPAYATKLSLIAKNPSVGAQKIDGLPLETYGIVSVSFSLQDNLRRVWFFEKTFLLANISMEVVLEMPFLFFSNIDVEFAELKKLIWRSYMAAEALPTTNRVELISKKKFAKTVLDENFETFVVHVAVLEAITLIHPSRTAQIAALW